MLPNIGAAHTNVFLVLSIDDFGHALGQQTGFIFLEESVPIASPDHLDHIPTRTTEDRFKLLNDLAVSSHRTVEALQIAINDKDKVVEFLTRSERNCTESFGLVAFSVTQERPYFLSRRILQPSVLQVLIKSSLINRHDGTKSHRDGWVLPKVWHQPRVRIAAQSTFGLKLLSKVLELCLTQSPFQKRSRIHPRRCVPLEVNDIPVIS